MANHWVPHVGREVPGLSGSTDRNILPSESDVAGFSVEAFRHEKNTDLMMPIWSPKFNNQSDDDAVYTVLARHLDKDFVSAQPSPAKSDCAPSSTTVK